ncbi:hypothetical protein [Saccharospirillum impatiens]|uniref:hypothetical protein n=1 Tax=Saccharospirillum impatiens TaxID=169438 RepID=UPI0003FDB150|nr:hypothetical protein [Saccharospirillum impatiens]
MRFFLILAIAVATLAGCSQGFEPVRDKPDPLASAKVNCTQTDSAFFEKSVWPVLTQCTACHQTGGSAPAQGARLVLDPVSSTNSLAAVRDYVALAGDRLVHKPTEYQMNHGGGGFFDADSDDALVLAEAVLRFGANAPQCSGDETVESRESGYDDVNLINRARTLRKASLLLAGELPGLAAADAVRADDTALRSALRELMAGPVFEAWLKTSANDHLLTRKYLTGMTEAQEALGGTYYEGLYDRTSVAFEASDQARLACESSGDPSSAECVEANALQQTAGVIFRETQRAIAEEPLELIRHVVTTDRPYSDVLTADYRMMNPFTYEVLDGETWVAPYDAMDPDDWRPGQVRRYRVDWGVSLAARTGRNTLPSAGILSSPVFQLRFPSTETNRNRARARWTYNFFLGVDIERLAVRAMDPEELQSVTNPGAPGSSCFGCHSIMDPVAGAFQNWGNNGHYLDRRGYDALPQTYVDSEDYVEGDRWYRGQLAPGFGTEALPTLSPYGPANGHDDGLTWLAERIVADPRFAEGTVKFWFQGVFGRDPLLQPLATGDADYDDRRVAWQAEQALMSDWAQSFRHSDYDLKVLLVEMMMSPLFRAETFSTLDAGRQAALNTLGVGRLLTPEQLDRKFTATTGYSWKLDWQNDPQLLENYYLFYGGIDSDGITERPAELNSLMTSVSMRLANEMACSIVLNEFWPGVSPTLFSGVTITTDPGTEAGEAAVRDTLRSLIWRLWGVTDDAEIDAAWSLYKALYDQRMGWDEPQNYLEWTALWNDAAPAEEEYCGIRDLNPDDSVAIAVDWSNVDWSTPQTARESLGSYYNPEQTLRPWVGVLIYLLTDIQFLTE